MAATINALIDIDCKPIRPDFWAVDAVTTVKLDDQPFTKLQITARASKDMQAKNWKRAASHCSGSGLEKGTPSFVAARKAITYLRKRGLLAQAQALEYAVVGFFREPKEEDMSKSAFCHRCGKRKRNTRWHQVYECADNAAITDDMFLKTNYLIKKAVEGCKVEACLWLRGMVPFDAQDCLGQVEIHEARI